MLNVEPRPTTESPAPAASAAASSEATASSAAAGTPPNPLLAIEVPERPALRKGVQLVGTMQGSGFESQQWLVQRGGDYIQVSELIYRIIEQINGERTLEEIAAAVAEVTGRPVSANNVRYVVQTRFVPLWLIEGVDPPLKPGEKPPKVGAKRGPQQGRSPLQLTLKLGFIGPRAIEFFARWLQYLFWPPIVALVVILAAATQLWMVFGHGINAIVDEVLSRPAELLPISTFVFISAVFHEYGHASALRYGGGRARGMGFGLYLMYPAFYTDCTDSYRLSRWARLRTDMGGIYFDLITGLGLFALYLVTHQEMLLAAIVLLDLEVADQFNPLMRFDGYWALADLVGVPDFYVLMSPVVRSMLPKRWRAKSAAAGAQSAPPLKGWVKTVFLGYTLVTVPAIYGFFAILLAYAPTLMATYYNSILEQQMEWAASQAQHDTAGVLLAAGQIAILLLTAYFTVFMLYGLVRQLWRALRKMAHASRRRPRATAWLLSAAAVVFFWYFWTPQVTAISQSLVQIAMASQGYTIGQNGPKMAYQPPAQGLPSPGVVPPATRTAPGQDGLPDPTATPAPVTQQAPQTGSRTTAKPAPDPHAKPDPNAKPDPSAKKTGNGQGSQPKPKPQPQPTPKPQPKPTRTPPTLPPLPIHIPTLPPLPGR
jgi:putative peptide zinc metalloprotease protein